MEILNRDSLFNALSDADFSTGQSLKQFSNPVNLSMIIKGFSEETGLITPDYTQELESVNNQPMMKSYVTKPLLYNQFVAKQGLRKAVCVNETDILLGYQYSLKIEKWNTDSNKLDQNFINNTEAPDFLDISPKKKILYTVTESKNVRFFNSETGKSIGKAVKLDLSNSSTVILDQDENRFAGRTDRQTVGIFDIESGKPQEKIHDPKMSKYLLSKDFSRIFMLKNDGSWQLKNVKSGAVEMKGTKPVAGVNFGGDGKNLMIVYADNNVEIVDLGTFKPIIKLKSVFNEIGDFSADGKHFAVSEDVNSVKIWSVKDRKPVGESIPSTKYTSFFRFSDDGSKIFVADNTKRSLQHQINIYDTKTGKNVTVPFAVSRINFTDVFPGEKRVMTINYDTGTGPIIPNL